VIDFGVLDLGLLQRDGDAGAANELRLQRDDPGDDLADRFGRALAGDEGAVLRDRGELRRVLEAEIRARELDDQVRRLLRRDALALDRADEVVDLPARLARLLAEELGDGAEAFGARRGENGVLRRVRRASRRR
jgi:hypothetical protein